ncbi:MAG TPA: plastocyanin/azurin family copper-binding protein [Gemmatimonadaceae bacterium]|nr:plastocyanin/azurin family copper-binding protein [Gemmatimonadaceae bacterium]
MRSIHKLSLAAVLASLAACGGGGEKQAETAQASPTPAAAAAPSGPITPGPGGKVITVELYSDATGNYFKPNEITANKGDVIRYTLKVGVHNVHFLPDSNVGKSGYPQAPSDMLQLPGQTYDVLVDWAPGKYYFQCDPHAALGMHGHVTVQ